MENLLTEKDLLILQACTGAIFVRDFDKAKKFIEETLGRTIETSTMALQCIYDECLAILKDQYVAILNKMNSQIEEAA